MSQEHNPQQDRLEAMLAELGQAKRAGVFESTPVSVEQLMATDVSAKRRGFGRRLLVGLQAVACIGLVIGLAARFQAGSSISDLGSGPVVNAGFVLGAQSTAALTGCLVGPTSAGTSGCSSADLDADGDIDLADFGAYQRFSQTAQ